MRYFVIAFVLIGLRAESFDSCVLCTTHHGTCGCFRGHVVCCDGYDAYACTCGY